MRDGPFYQFWVYIMASHSGTLYIGVTGSIEQRVQQHKSGLVEGFAKQYGCSRLVYYEGYDEISRAIGREKQLKGWRRSKKIALIEKDEPPMEGSRRTLGTRDAVSGTEPQENSLNLHDSGHALGVPSA
jgi:putative endonuclease